MGYTTGKVMGCGECFFSPLGGEIWGEGSISFQEEIDLSFRSKALSFK